MADHHALTATDVAGELGVDPDVGLTADEVERRRAEYGRNRLGDPETVRWWQLLWQQLANAVVLVLIGAALVGLAVGEVIEAIAIAVVLVINTIVGFATEYQAARSMASLRTIMRSIADVERDNRRDEIDASELVPGDIVRFEAGDKIPADIRLVTCEDLLVEEAGLTGESEPVAKDPAPVDQEIAVADRTCMAWMGTTVVGGRGKGIVIATGTSTQMGRIAELAESADQGKAPLQEGLDVLSRRLAVIVVIGAAGLVGIGIARGRELGEVAEVAVALAIAVVPEGLPAVATLTLAVGMRRMAADNALVRRMPAVETLGSTTVICSDKTGTLTRHQMEVVDRAVAEGADEPDVWVSAALCNDADVDPDGDPVGDPTEVALLDEAGSQGIDWRALRERHERSREVPFDSEMKRMAVVIDDVVHVKGAPEALLDPDRHRELIAASERMAEHALRVLAIARRAAPEATAPDAALFEDLEILAVVGLHDPPRPEAVEAVEALHAAGIRTVMITGDRPDTAEAIAADMDVSEGGSVTGQELEEMSPGALADVVRTTDVFARVDPSHKLQIIAALQRHGEIVAVTGDGVNDAPALRQADVGVAMGGGTDAAREAADIVLLDDRFSTIEHAIEEGRRIFTNIRRFAQFLFSWHVAEVAVIALSVIAGFPAPLAGLMILWNNLVIDVLPSFALALEPGRSEVMRHPPRDPSQPVVDGKTLRRIFQQAALVAAVGLGAFALGSTWLELGTGGAQTVTFGAMSLGQVLTVFNARSDEGSGFRGASRNPWLWLALAITAILEGIALTVPALRSVLGLTSIPAQAWAVVVALGLVPVGSTQLWRAFKGRNGSDDR